MRLARPEKPLRTIVIDSREQLPYEFARPDKSLFADGGVVEYKLDEGDYGVELDGVLLTVRVERKTITDFFGVVGRGRERFMAELERLRAHRAYLVIEATAEEVRHGTERSLVSGNAAWASALCWSVRYGIAPIFAGNRRLGAATTQKLLEEFAKHSQR